MLEGWVACGLEWTDDVLSFQIVLPCIQIYSPPFCEKIVDREMGEPVIQCLEKADYLDAFQLKFVPEYAIKVSFLSFVNLEDKLGWDLDEVTSLNSF